MSERNRDVILGELDSLRQQAKASIAEILVTNPEMVIPEDAEQREAMLEAMLLGTVQVTGEKLIPDLNIDEAGWLTSIFVQAQAYDSLTRGKTGNGLYNELAEQEVARVVDIFREGSEHLVAEDYQSALVYFQRFVQETNTLAGTPDERLRDILQQTYKTTLDGTLKAIQRLPIDSLSSAEKARFELLRTMVSYYQPEEEGKTSEPPPEGFEFN